MILTDHSKAFDYINHNLLIAKLTSHGFEKQSIDLIYYYLTKRKQRTNVKCLVCSFKMLFPGIPQSSVLGPFLFNIIPVICFLKHQQILALLHDADDNATYTYSSNIKMQSTGSITKMFHWFSTNHLVVNAGKFP